ncbi:MAG: hypothetical protein VX641_02990 [Planctomycetota bacterium]|nr:hypothetical protein [Planctomycetota bacterium]
MRRIHSLLASIVLTVFHLVPQAAIADEDFIVVGVDAETIQEAIDLAAGRTILVPPGSYSEELEVDPGAVTIRSQVQGSKVLLTDFDGTVSARITVNPGAQLSLTDFTVENAGIAIQVESGGQLVLTACELSNNLSAVQLESGSSLSAQDCAFRGNGGYFFDGPAINARFSPLVLENCEFTDNGGNPGFPISTRKGGAISIEGGTILATDCLFRGNSAEASFESGTEFNSCEGGAVFASGLTGFSRFFNCDFDDNRVIADIPFQFGNRAFGASLAVIELENPLSIESCTFRNGLARFSVSGGYASGPSEILVDGDAGSSVNFINNIVRDSRIEYLDPEQNAFDPTNANGVLLRADEVLIVASEFRNLPARGLDVWNTLGQGEVSLLGSDFFNCGTVMLEVPSTCSGCTFDETALVSSGDVSSCTFERISREDALYGNALTIFGSDPVVVTGCSFHQVGADYVFGSADYTISQVTVCGNSATPFAPGASWVDSGENMIEGGPSGVDPCPAAVVRTVPGDHDTIDAALLAANNGDEIRVSAGIYNETIDLRGFSTLSLTGAGARSTLLRPGTGGPVVLIEGGSIQLTSLAVQNGSPGIQMEGGLLQLTDSRLADNVGVSGAGLMLGPGGSAFLQDVEFDSNAATGDGGAINVGNGGSLVVSNGTFNANLADGTGGAINVENGAALVEIDSSLFDSNIALGNGGALRLGAVDTASCSDTTFVANEGGRFGGAASVLACRFERCTFTANSADDIGGGVRSDGSSVLIECTFFGNTAQRAGGLAGTAVQTFVDEFGACGNFGGDWFGNIVDLSGTPLFCGTDCNGNGVDDDLEIESGLASDCNANGVIDACEGLADLDQNGIPDACDPAGNETILVSELARLDGFSASAVDVLARPLYRDPLHTHDLLILDPASEGQVIPVRPDALGGYVAGAGRSGSLFEGCCAGGGFPVCLNNGPAGGEELIYARGDVLIAHNDKDTGLYDEEFNLYLGCDAPSGQGAPEAITDYDLAPQSEFLLAHDYQPASDEGLAGGGLDAQPRARRQAVLGVRRPNSLSARTGGRRGSGQGGAGPYPGVDAVDLFDFAVSDMAVGDFDGDGNDDLVVLDATNSRFSIRTFTGLADYNDEQGALVPSGAIWSAPITYGLNTTPLAVVTGDFFDIPGDDRDDGLDDLALLVDDQGQKLLYLLVTSQPNFLSIVSAYTDLGSDLELGTIGTGLGGRDLVLVAQTFSNGFSYLDYIAIDSRDPEQLVTGYVELQAGTVTALSTSRTNEGGSAREVAAVLLDRGDQSSLHVLELSMRPANARPANDDCANPVDLESGDHPFSTVGATSGGQPLTESCWSDGEQQPSNDVWFRWRAPSNGSVVVSTCGAADFDTWLVVQEAVCDGPILACNDQNPECPGNTSQLEFEAVAGIDYLIRVGGWQEGVIGEGTLSITQASSLGDIDSNGVVNGADLALLLASWGQPGSGDLNGSGTTDGADLALLLANWSS